MNKTFKHTLETNVSQLVHCQLVQPGAPNLSKFMGNFGVLGGLSPKICIASMGHLRFQGGLEPPPQPPGFGAYAYNMPTRTKSTENPAFRCVLTDISHGVDLVLLEVLVFGMS